MAPTVGRAPPNLILIITSGFQLDGYTLHIQPPIGLAYLD